MQNNNIQNNRIRNFKKQLRNKIKSNLKLPMFRIKLEKFSVQHQQNNTKRDLDKRKFQNVFRIDQKIGQGCNAVVRKCIQIKTGLIYAVKIANGDEQLIRIWKRTYNILKMFDHESIIKAKNLFIDETTENIFLVMQYCSYFSLKHYIDYLSYQQIKTIIKQLLQVTLVLHTKGVCHRDFKPQNILYDSQTTKIKIIDFGVSKLLFKRKQQFKQKMWTVTGTIHYKAPEMFQGGQYDQLIDIWAIGIITYQLLYKKLPFTSQYTCQIIDQILQSEPQYKDLQHNQSSLAIDFMKALLKKQSKNRINCKQALRHPWIENNTNVDRYKKFASQDMSHDEFYFNIRNSIKNHIPQLSPTSVSTINYQFENNLPSKIDLNNLKLSTNDDIIEIHKQIDNKDWICEGRGNKEKPKSTKDFEFIQQLKQESQIQIFGHLERKYTTEETV